MGMLIAWHTCNQAAGGGPRFSDRFLVVAPGTLFDRGLPVTITHERPRFTLSGTRASGGVVTSENRSLAQARIGPVRYSVHRSTDVAG